jgi:nucleotide-binding universal stress UspA family protein
VSADVLPAVPARRGKAVRGRLAGVKVRGTPLASSRSASVLLASEGRDFSAASVELAGDLAREAGGTVLVLSIARVHGVSFGMQTPGLMPTKAEWDEQHACVRKAVAKLKRRGVQAEGQVLGTRKASQRICALADELGAGAIVMGADRSRNRLIAGMMWTQEPQAVRRRARVPVHLTTDAGSGAGGR